MTYLEMCELRRDAQRFRTIQWFMKQVRLAWHHKAITVDDMVRLRQIALDNGLEEAWRAFRELGVEQ